MTKESMLRAFSSRCVAICVASFASSFALPAQEVRKASEFFEVVVHGGDEQMAEQALAAVEPVWPLVCEMFSVQDRKPAKPLQVHLYRTTQDYLDADRQLTGGKFQANEAMSHWQSKSAHVALQPPVSDTFLKARGLPHQTQTMLAWEACHVSRYELCKNFRVHPGWFVDGLAATTAQRVMELRHPGLGSQPFFEGRLARVLRMFEEEQMPPLLDLLDDETQDLHMRDRYAARVVLFDFLRQQRAAKLARFAEVVRETGAGTGYFAKVREAATSAFGRSDAAFEKFARGAERRWDEPLRSMWCERDEWVQVAFPKRNAIAWRVEPVAGESFSITGTCRTLPGDASQMNVLFAGTDEGFYSLAMFPGGFTLFDHRTEGNEWRRVGGVAEPAIVRGEPVEFGVRGGGQQVEVRIGERTWSFDLPRPLPEKVRWGLGAQAGGKGAATGTAGLWSGVEAR